MLTHELRAAHDAILVGVNTVLADDPRLTVRLAQGNDPQPIVLDSTLKTPYSCKLIGENTKKPWIFSTEIADAAKHELLEKGGCRVFTVSSDLHGKANLSNVLEVLFDLGIHSVMVEGGARIITSFYSQRFAHFVVVTIAPVILGGMGAIWPKELGILFIWRICTPAN